jgi:hypothetical protein
MDKPKPNKLAQFYSGQIQPNGALSLRRSVQFWSGVDILRQMSLHLSVSQQSLVLF